MLELVEVRVEPYIDSDGGFDPGSGLTLAACLSHASRAGRPARGGQRRTAE